MRKLIHGGLIFGLILFNFTAAFSFQLRVKIYRQAPNTTAPLMITGLKKPIFSHDGKFLIFGLKYVKDNKGGILDAGDVYLTKLENDNWTEPENLGSPINNDSPNGPISFLADNRNLYLLNKYGLSGPSSGLSMSTKVNGKWRLPVNQKIENLEIRGPYSDFYVHPNGHLLLLAIENDKGLGSQDIFISERKGKDEWAEPMNLGENINTSGAEYAPFFGADGKTIYFTHSSSPDSATFRESKILMSRKTAGGWAKGVPLPDSLFTKPMNSYLSILTNFNYAMFIEQDSIADIGNPKSVFLDEKLLPEPVKELNGIILRKKNDKPTKVAIKAINLRDNALEAWVYSHKEDGFFSIFLREGEEYQIEFGEGSGKKTLKLKVDDYLDFEKIKVDVKVD